MKNIHRRYKNSKYFPFSQRPLELLDIASEFNPKTFQENELIDISNYYPIIK